MSYLTKQCFKVSFFVLFALSTFNFLHAQATQPGAEAEKYFLEIQSIPHKWLTKYEAFNSLMLDKKIPDARKVHLEFIADLPADKALLQKDEGYNGDKTYRDVSIELLSFFYDMANDEFKTMLNYVEAYSPSQEQLRKAHEAQDNFMKESTRIITKMNLVGDAFIKKHVGDAANAAFCKDIQNLLVQLDVDFKDLKGDEVPGTMFGGKYVAKSLPTYAFEGEVNTSFATANAIFYYFRGESLQEAESTINNLIQLIETCGLGWKVTKEELDPKLWTYSEKSTIRYDEDDEFSLGKYIHLQGSKPGDYYEVSITLGKF
jgi:hypothetical protein